MKNIKNWLFRGAPKTDISNITELESHSDNIIKEVLSDEELLRSDKEIFLLRSLPILRLLVESTTEFKENKMSLITSPYFDSYAINQMTTDETYDFLVSCESRVSRGILSHSFPKHQDFDTLVKLLEDGNQERFKAEITKKGNRHFYSYCIGVKNVNEIEQKLKDVSLLVNILSPLSTQEDKAQKIDMLNSDSEWARQLINPADSDFEPVITLYKMLLNMVAYFYMNAIVTDVQKQEICDLFRCSYYTDIFDVSKYIEECITVLKVKPNSKKKQSSEKIVPIVPLEELIAVKIKEVRDEDKSKIVVENIKKYYKSLIDKNQSIKGVATGKLFIALRELRYLSQTDVSIFIESITEFGQREIDVDFNIGANKGLYRFISDDLKKRHEDIERLKKKLDKCCNEVGNIVESVESVESRLN